MISIVTLTDDQALRRLSPDELRAELESDRRRQSVDDDSPASQYDHTIWIDLVSPTAAEEDLILRQMFDLHSLAIEDCHRSLRDGTDHDGQHHLPKVEDYTRYLFAIINPVRVNEDGDELALQTDQMNAFIGEDFIITHHYAESPAIGKAFALCNANPRHIQRGPDYIYHIILDFMTDELSVILDMFDSRIDTLEDEVFENTARDTLQKLLRMKRQVFQLRRITTYQREMVYRLSRGEFDLISDSEIAYYRNVFDHLVRAADLSESYRDVLTGLLDAYLSMTSNRMNEVMKVLTIISTVFLPLTFIVGLYGMNFEKMPELKWDLGYLFAWIVMIATAIGMLVFFRHRKWL